MPDEAGSIIRGAILIMPWGDNFNDNSIDTSKWAALQVSPATVAETNQRLEVTLPTSGAWKQSGLVTLNPWNLSGHYCEVNVAELDSLQYMLLLISLTKVTASDPTSENNWYYIAKRRSDAKWRVARRVNGGTVSEQGVGAWAAATGKLKISISGTTINLYENNNLRVSETYALASTTVYIYIFQSTSETTGTDAFDDFQTDFGVAYTITVTEILGMVDSVARKAAFKKTVSESLGMVEAVAKQKAMYQTISEILGMRDGVEVRKHVGRLGDLPDHYREGGA